MSADSTSETAAPDDVPWLSPDQMRDWLALVDLLATLPPALDTQLKRDAGVNSYEYQVLATLSDAPHRTIGLRDLAESTQGSLSRLSHAVTRLERSGWVERRSCTDPNGRRMNARLTDAGLAKLVAVAPGHVREARRLVVGVLTPEQLTALGDAARAINAATTAAVGLEAHRDLPGGMALRQTGDGERNDGQPDQQPLGQPDSAETVCLYDAFEKHG